LEAIILSLAAAFSWGAVDFGAGLKARRLSVFTVVGGMQLVGSVGAAAMLLVAHDTGLATQTAALGLAAGGVTALGLAALYQGLAIGPMSLVAPISATGVAIPVLAGLITGDEPSAAQGAGMALAIAGMLVAVRGSTEAGGVANDRPRFLALGLGAFSALGLGAFFLTSDAVDPGQGTWYLLLGQLSACAILALLVFAQRAALPSRSDLPGILVLGGTSFAAWAFSKAALDAGYLSLTATIISMYPVVTTLLAVAVVREAVRPVQALGLVCAFAGVALIAAG
jgi:drug/metabolite transporter (DMT)-like permease